MVNSAEEKAMKKREQEWQAEDDARILKRAHEIMMDKGRHARAGKVVEKELKALQNVAGKIVGGKKPQEKKPSAPKKPSNSKKK